jgi:HSP20 family protein
MFTRKDKGSMLRRLTAELDRMFDETAWPEFPRPLRTRDEVTRWVPRIEVFEKEDRLVTRVDLPGMKKEDVKVEVVDGHLLISGERTRETETTEEYVYRSEREYGSFYRAVPLPEGVKLDDVKATFADGVLEVMVPVLARIEEKPRRVEIQEVGTAKEKDVLAAV